MSNRKPKKRTAKRAKAAAAAKKKRARASTRDTRGRFAPNKREGSKVEGGSLHPSSLIVHPSGGAAAQKRKQALALFLARQPVSTHQVKLVCDYIRPLFARVPQKLVTELLTTSKQACANWTRQGAPRNDDGTWPLPNLLRWLKEKWVKTSRKGGGSDVRDAEAAIDLQIKEEKLRREKHINELREASVMPRDMVRPLLLELVGFLVSPLQGLVKLAPSLAGKPAPVVRRIVDMNVKKIRRGLYEKARQVEVEVVSTDARRKG